MNAMQINKYHGSYNRSKRSVTIKYICVHYTGGTGSALNNCKYFAGGNRNASADYFVDDNGIWEYNDPSEGYYTWAVGDGKGKYGITNSNSINIEVVNNGGAFSAKEIAYLCELVPYLMNKYGVSASNVVRHYDASRKSCPAGYVDSNAWNTLRSQITGGKAPVVTTTSTTATAKTTTTTSSGSISVDGKIGKDTITLAQKLLGTTADGVISGQYSKYKKYWTSIVAGCSWSGGSSALVKAIQRKIGTTADGILGQCTAKALQKYLINKGYSCGSCGADGYFGTDSAKAFQRWLNDGAK